MRELVKIGLRLAFTASVGFGVPLTAKADEPETLEANALGASIEFPAHRRLIEVMDEAGHRPAPFTTDGCSGGLSSAWDMIAKVLPAFEETHQDHPPWESCCLIHDHAYHTAGGASSPEESYRERLAADHALKECVRDTGETRSQQLSETYGLTAAQVTNAYSLISTALFDAVRLGGGPCSGLSWRWGYGYSNCFWPK